MISDSHRFVFMRMRKVASTSMYDILLEYVNPMPTSRFARIRSRAGLDRDYRKRVYRLHDEFRVAQHLMSAELFDSYFKFAFVRNPWERLVSEYEFLLRTPTHGRHVRVSRMKHFREYIEMQIPRPDAYQINMLTGLNGEIVADFIGKFEQLAEDWQVVCENIGIPYQPLPHRKKSGRSTDFRVRYTPADVDLVAQHWQREIDQFDYSFED